MGINPVCVVIQFSGIDLSDSYRKDFLVFRVIGCEQKALIRQPEAGSYKLASVFCIDGGL